MNEVLRQRRVRMITIAAALVVAGFAVLALLFRVQTFPRPFWLWALFAAGFVYFEWRSVEINDHLMVSPSVMVALTAAVIFGSGSATLGVAVMGGMAFLHPRNISQRQWFQPMANFGQIVLTATVATYVLEAFLPAVITRGSIWRVAVGSAVASSVYGAVNLTIVAWVVKRVFQRRDMRPWSRMAANHLPHLGMGFLGGLLGVTYHFVGPVTLPLIFTAFFVGHMTFASYGQLREAQEATLRGFIKALEAKDLYTRGHTERVAYFAQMIAEEMGFGPTRMERVRWAALIHDVGKLAVPRELIRKRARLSDAEYAVMQHHVHAVEDILSEVAFLQPMVQIASGHHSHYDGSGYGGSGHTHGETPCIEARILAVADAFDAMTSSRSYRLAMSQEYAIRELRENAGSQFDPDVVDAFVTALLASGERYGSTDLHDDREARRRAEAYEAEARHG